MFKIVKLLFIFTFFISSCGSSGASNSNSARSVQREGQIFALNEVVDLINRGIFRLKQNIQEKMKRDDFTFVNNHLQQTIKAIDQFKELTFSTSSWYYKIRYDRDTNEIEGNELFSNFLFLFLNNNVDRKECLGYLKEYFPQIVLQDELDKYRSDLKDFVKTFIDTVYESHKGNIDGLKEYDEIKEGLVNSKIESHFLFNNTNKGYYQMKYAVNSLVEMMSGYNVVIIQKITEDLGKKNNYIENGSFKRNWVKDGDDLLKDFEELLTKEYMQKLKADIDRENNYTTYR